MLPTYRLVEADTTALFAAARALIQEYGAEVSGSMAADLCFQNFAGELEELPAMYGPPSGCLLLAGRDDVWVGCCGLRRFSHDVCEMKRLYVKPSARGAGLGGQLIERLLTRARALGYRRMVLDTLEDMIAAQTLYRSFGFRSTKPYYFNPIRGASYMELDLGTAE
jgi:ribosomal protein S18 acetylase RimI-like enzyme